MSAASPPSPARQLLVLEVLLGAAILWSGAVAVTAGRVQPLVAAPAGVAAGCALAAALVALDRRPAVPRRPGRRLLGAAVVLTLVSAAEEVLWRGLAYGGLADELGPSAAFAVVTIAFALVHGERTSMLVNLATGSAFGGLLLATGGLAAPIAAHAAYNLAVLLSPGRLARAAAAGAQPAIEARGVTKRFRSIEALAGFDLEIAPGEVVALLGPNGAGKTTAIQVMLGLRRPDAGTVRVLGREPGDLETRRRLGVTLQETGSPPLLRVAEVVGFVRAHFDRGPDLDELLHRFGLHGLRRRQVGGLSGGERRRLALALAFAGDPELVFLDEPTTGLDVESRRAVWDAIGGYASSGGTILLTTHYLEEAEALSSRVAVMRAGRIVVSGRASDVKRSLRAPTLEDAFLRLTGADG